jgi:hypothetical protein
MKGKLLAWRRRAVPLLAVASAAIAASVLAGPASAAPVRQQTTTPAAVRPADAQSCGGNTCMYLSYPTGIPGNSGVTVYVNAWAYHNPFYGYFILTGPDGIRLKSSTTTWYAGGAHYTFSNVKAVAGVYCATGYSGSASEGSACNYVEN